MAEDKQSPIRSLVMHEAHPCCPTRIHNGKKDGGMSILLECIVI